MQRAGNTDYSGALMDTPERDSFKEGATTPQRNVMTSIYWMATPERPNLWWAINKSDHVHYYQAGAALTYYIIHPDGKLEKHVLGPNVEKGEVMQFVVQGGRYKCALMEDGGDFALIGEAVAPGFDFHDFRFGSEEEMSALEGFKGLENFVKPDRRRNFDEYYEK
eukprot:scaffold942_cov366-Prasinococcus_capsulatus_cf.AAC.5